MSIQGMTRFVGILTLDHRKLARFLPVDADGKLTQNPEDDVNVGRRNKMIEEFYPSFDPDLEVPILQSGNMTTIFDYIFETAPRPVPDFDTGG